MRLTEHSDPSRHASRWITAEDPAFVEDPVPQGAGQAGRAADPAAFAATEDWLRTTRQREIPKRDRNIEI
jgi:hypothetical protein